MEKLPVTREQEAQQLLAQINAHFPNLKFTADRANVTDDELDLWRRILAALQPQRVDRSPSALAGNCDAQERATKPTGWRW